MVSALNTFSIKTAKKICVFKIDGFNSVNRESLMIGVKLHVQGIDNFILQCYTKHSKLLYRANELSSMGWQQGGPWLMTGLSACR